MRGKHEMIVERCGGKKVLHVGCCSTPFCRQFCREGRLLHLKIREVASELWGLDICKEDIAYLENEYQVENLVVGDAEEIDRLFPEAAFEMVVAGDLIEHLLNPGLFLKRVMGLIAPGGNIIVSVPNGLAFHKGLKSLFGMESVHAEHNFYFSRETLSRLLSACGYQVVEIHGFRMMDGSVTAAIDLVAGIFSQWACEGVLAVARPLSEQSPEKARP